MKILCVIDSLGSGGAQRQLVGLAIGFKEKGHDVSFLVYHNEDFFEGVLNRASIPIYKVLENNYLLRLIKMRQFIRKGKYDSVLSFLEAANFICEISGLPWRKWKLVVGERNADPKILLSTKLRFFRLFHIFADEIVSNSRKNIELVLKANPLIPSKKCSVIFNLIDFDYWKPAKEKRSKISDKLKLVVAARHEKQKNLVGLIEAVQLLKDHEKEKLEITWYGGNVDPPYLDDYFPKIFSIIKDYELSSVFKFISATDEIVSRLQEADVVGLFSFYEGFPNAICEGMACGKPIITTNVADIECVVIQDVNGIVINSFDSEAISLAISKLLSYPKEVLGQMGDNSLIVARSLFEKDNIVDQYLKLMN